MTAVIWTWKRLECVAVVRDWIYGYPFERMCEIRRLVLEDALPRLQSDPIEQHFGSYRRSVSSPKRSVVFCGER